MCVYVVFFVAPFDDVILSDVVLREQKGKIETGRVRCKNKNILHLIGSQ